MDREQIIQVMTDIRSKVSGDDAQLEAFAIIIRAATKEEDAKICEDAKPVGGRMWTDEQSACFDCLTHVAEYIRASK